MGFWDPRLSLGQLVPYRRTDGKQADARSGQHGKSRGGDL